MYLAFLRRAIILSHLHAFESPSSLLDPHARISATCAQAKPSRLASGPVRRLRAAIVCPSTGHGESAGAYSQPLLAVRTAAASLVFRPDFYCQYSAFRRQHLLHSYPGLFI